MVATALDLSQIKTDALSSAATFRSLIELGSTDTPTFKRNTLTGGTVTTSTPVLNATQTWNDAAVTFTGMKLDVTDTASASGSKLLDLQVGGTSQFKVDKDGHFVRPQSTLVYDYWGLNSLSQVGAYDDGSVKYWFVQFNGTQATFAARLRANVHAFSLSPDVALGWNSSTSVSSLNPDLRLYRDAANTLAQRNDANAQEYRLYNTWTSPGTSYERAFLKWDANVFKIGTEAAGTGTARNLQFDADKVGFGIDPSVTFHIQANDGQIRISDPDSTSTENARGYFEIWHQNISRAGYFGLISNKEMSIATGMYGGRFAVMTGLNQFALSIDYLQNSRFYGDLELRDGTDSTAFTLYKTYTDASNYERAFLKWDANVFKIGTEAAGTGTARTLTIENVAKINGSTSSAADPSTTEYPNDGDHGIHKNTTSGNVFLAYNDGGSSIVKVQLS